MSNHPKHIHPYFSFRVYVVTYGYHGWAHLGSNQGPTGYEPVALPIELWALAIWIISPFIHHPAGCLCYTAW